MLVPVMQQEWQRRQMQRSVWALLGVLAVVAAGAAPTPATAPPEDCRTIAAMAAPAVGEVGTQPRASSVRANSSPRYWRQLEPLTDAGVRLRLTLHAVERPAWPARLRYLRQFLRPPTS